MSDPDLSIETRFRRMSAWLAARSIDWETIAGDPDAVEFYERYRRLADAIREHDVDAFRVAWAIGEDALEGAVAGGDWSGSALQN